MKALFTSFHMLYCLSQNSKYFLRYDRMTIAVLELSHGQFPPPVSQCRSSRSDSSATRATIHKRIDVCKSSLPESWSFTDINSLVNCRSGR